MPLETGDYVDDLVETNPAAGDVVSQGDDHLRLIKKVLRNTLLGIRNNYIYRAGGTDVPIADGGTGASTAVAARTNLSVPGLNNSNILSGVNTFTARVEPSGGLGFTKQLTIADDAATSIEIVGAFTYFMVFIVPNAAPAGALIAAVRVGTSVYCEGLIANVANVTTATGALLGTTGVDGNLTISAHTDSKLYIENRTGASRVYTVTLIGMNGGAVS